MMMGDRKIHPAVGHHRAEAYGEPRMFSKRRLADGGRAPPSAHGEHFMTRNSTGKMSPHEASVHVPLLLCGPGFWGEGAPAGKPHRPAAHLVGGGGPAACTGNCRAFVFAAGAAERGARAHYPASYTCRAALWHSAANALPAGQRTGRLGRPLPLHETVGVSGPGAKGSDGRDRNHIRPMAP